MKVRYYKLKSGDRCITLEDVWDYGKLIEAGTEFEIISFPPYVCWRYDIHYQFFVRGETDDGRTVRIDYTKVKKI